MPETPKHLPWEQLVQPGPAPKKSAKVDPKDEQHPLEKRARTRFVKRAKARRQRKGQRAYVRDVLRQEYVQGTQQAQAEVLRHGDPQSPVYRNVYNALSAQYGEDKIQEALNA